MNNDKPRPSLCERLLVNPFRIGPSAGALGEFYHQLAAMLRAGLTVVRALDTLEQQSGSGSIRRRIPLMKQHITDGGNAAGAFALFPQTFDPVHVAMIRAGEAGGRLDEVLEMLAETCKRRSRLVKRFITAIAYPALLLNFALFAVPFIEHLQNSNIPYWRLALPKLGVFYGVVVLVFVVPRMMREFPATAYALDALKGLAPVVSRVAEKLAVARFARSVDGLYSSGMTFAEAIPVAADACGNEILRRRVCRMAPLIADGQPLSHAMKCVGGFPPAFVNMIATGEEGGQISQMLTNAATYHEDEAETALNRVAVILPVIIYIAVAAYIGFQIVKAWSGLLGDRYEGMNELSH